MAKLTTDSPLCRRIILSFLDFLDSVERAPGVDLEGLEVAKDCLSEVFKIDLPLVNNRSKTDSLVEIFNSLDAAEQVESKSDICHEGFSADAPSTSSARPRSVRYNDLDEDWTREAHSFGNSKDELYGRLFGALEKIGYFKSTPDGHDDQVQLDRTANIFHNALTAMHENGCVTFDSKNLAETLKSQGNKAMHSSTYSDAVELYTFAIALSDDNVVYYCNRAAAYTQLHQYQEAISDCLKAIEIDPNYGKAYSRLGFAYYAQGKYKEAIDKGFMKALQLDPNNDSVKENIRVAEQKLKEEQERTRHDQSSSSSSNQRESSHQPFTSSMPFNPNMLPADIANMFMNMASNAHPNENRSRESEGPNTFDEPEIRIGGNFNINLGDQMPQDITGTLRSVMEMFGGAMPRGNSQDNTSRGGGRPS